MKTMEGLDIYDYNGPDFQVVHSFGAWRVAYLRQSERFTPEGMTQMERHMETDEIFVLLQGKATLLLGEEIVPQEMEIGKVYNIRKAVWHNILVSEDAKVLVVENTDTVAENSEYFPAKAPKI